MEADQILINGRVYLNDGSSSFAEAIAIRGSRIVATGTSSQIKALLSQAGRLVDLQGALVIPGLTDAHVHLMNYGIFLQEVDLNDSRDEAEAVRLIVEKANSIGGDGWIKGFGWDQTRWENGSFPTFESLDEVFPDRPVYMTARSGHAAWVNSVALRLAGITAETSDPAGAKIARDDAGHPTGIFFEDGAMALVREHIPRPSQTEIIHSVKIAMRRANEAGLTGIHDVDGITAFTAYQQLHARGEVSLRILKNLPVDHLDAIIESGLTADFGDDWLRIGGIKFFADGALGPRTAWMLAPYEGESQNTGIPTMAPNEMLSLVLRASRAGLPSLVHAIGDRAVRSVLDIFAQARADERARGVKPDELRHRIEHVQLIHPQDRRRLAEQGIIASMQPIHAISDMEMADLYWGERAENAYDWRGQLEAGAVLAFGSDAPIEPIEPLPNLQAAVTRRRPDGYPGREGWRSAGGKRLNLSEAIRGFTTGPAYAAKMEDRLGKIHPGYLADLTVLDRDIFTCDPMEISKVEVLGTVVDGCWVVDHLS